MTTFLIVLGAVVVAVVLTIALINTKYSKVFADAHLIEVCEVLDRIRDHGCARPEWDDAEHAPQTVEETLADLRNAETSGGLRLRYTVTVPRENPERGRHYLSMSQADRLPAEAMARFFVGLALLRYGLPPEAVTVGRSRNLVTHMMWEIPDADRLQFAADEQPVPAKSELIDLRKRASAAGQAVALQELKVSLPH